MVRFQLMKNEVIQRACGNDAVDKNLIRKTTSIFKRFGNLGKFHESLSQEQDTDTRADRLNSQRLRQQSSSPTPAR